MTFLGFFLGCLAACAGQTTGETRPSQLPVSAERIQERLNLPPGLFEMLFLSQADFRASVTEEFEEHVPTVLEAARIELAGDLTPKPIIPGTISPALVSFDVLPMAMLLKQKLGGALRARRIRGARRDVEASLAEFCATRDCSVVEQAPEKSRPEGILTH